MDLAGVRVDLPSNAPVVLLREAGGMRMLPIFITSDQATSIAHAIQGVVPPRPLTHDLMRDMLTELGARLDSVVITEMREGTYFAELHVTANGSTHIVSSRPSDAIALAARTGSPIYCEDSLLDAEGVVLSDDEDDDDDDRPQDNPDELVVQFRDFIENIRPEDFGA
jgi:bifunctional DNase/RNase